MPRTTDDRAVDRTGDDRVALCRRSTVSSDRAGDVNVAVDHHRILNRVPGSDLRVAVDLEQHAVIAVLEIRGDLRVDVSTAARCGILRKGRRRDQEHQSEQKQRRSATDRFIEVSLRTYTRIRSVSGYLQLCTQ